jgi:hypothetical protein
MIKIEYSLLVRKPSADVLSYNEHVAQNGDDQAKTELAYLLDLDHQLYALYPTLRQPTTGLEIDKEYMMFDNWDQYQIFENHLLRLYDERAHAVFRTGIRYYTANNFYVSRLVKEIDEKDQVNELMNGFVDY